MYEKLVKRTVFVAACKNDDFRDVRTEDAPREIQCPNCKTWLKFEEESWTGKDL